MQFVSDKYMVKRIFNLDQKVLVIENFSNRLLIDLLYSLNKT
jgi:hypothetical protein